MHKSRNSVVATVGALVVAATLAAGGTPASAAASQSFFSSFESADPQPTWTNTVDGGKSRASPGPKPTGIPGNVTDKVVDGHGQRREPGSGEVKENLVDGDIRQQVAGVRAHRLGRATSSPSRSRSCATR